MICYQVTNIVTGKVYIGLTATTLVERWARHMEHAAGGRGYALHDAIRKYGVDAFMIDEVASPIVRDREALADLERFLIAQAGSIAPRGYNLTAGGEGVGGCEETSRKISASLTGKKLSDAHRKALSEGAKRRIRKPCSPETAAKISVANKGKPGRAHTEESKEKCRIAGLKRKPIPCSQEHREKMSKLMTGHKPSPETIEKKRQAQLRIEAAKRETRAAIEAAMHQKVED